MSREGGGWFVLCASRDVPRGPSKHRIDGRELVAWRDGDELRVAPASCPHMGADLGRGTVRDGKLVCAWHGLALGPEGHGAWRCFAAHDDGVLAWVRLPNREEPTERPVTAPRPDKFIAGVIRVDADCEPEDVIANRLDPWHGVHYHPHSFAALHLLDAGDDVITLRVSYKVAGPLCVEVDATFHSPSPRIIVMTIVDGDGVGSVVETHATPFGAGRTAIIEATLATSDRPGFRAARLATPLLRRLIERRAARLWLEDAAYAERRAALRAGNGSAPSERKPREQPARRNRP
jgi:isorenieratene synthase